jgi:NNP family nitrate/nitrite transporter-like MFS transporter
MVGAFGNVGGLAFLTVLSFVSSEVFFLTIAATAVFVFLCVVVFVDGPKGQIAEKFEDGSVELIDVK